jgi:hypothetical protein
MQLNIKNNLKYLINDTILGKNTLKFNLNSDKINAINIGNYIRRGVNRENSVKIRKKNKNLKKKY